MKTMGGGGEGGGVDLSLVLTLGLMTSVTAAKQCHHQRRCNTHSWFVCKIQYPRLVTHAHVVSHFFEVPLSRHVVFVTAIQKELPITLLIIKGLKWIHEGVCHLSTV